MVPKGTLASGRSHDAESGRVPGVLVAKVVGVDPDTDVGNHLAGRIRV